MILFLVRRAIALVAILLVLSILVFSLLSLVPGSEIQTLLGTHPATPSAVQALRREYHLNASFIHQYLAWLGNAVQLNFGRSVVEQEPVRTLLAQRIGLSIELVVLGFAVALVFGVGLGTAAALKQGRWLDRAIVALSLGGFSMPAFVTGLLLIYVFAVTLPILPAFGGGTGGADRLSHLLLPAIALAFGEMALLVRVTRAAMIGQLRGDHVTFALARGVPESRTILTYGLRNALIPIVTVAGLLLSYLLTAAVLVESTFSIPGLGSLLVDSILQKDIPVVQALALLLAITIVSVNLGADILIRIIDPRVRLAR